jgi:hypothetical protein
MTPLNLNGGGPGLAQLLETWIARAFPLPPSKAS